MLLCNQRLGLYFETPYRRLVRPSPKPAPRRTKKFWGATHPPNTNPTTQTQKTVAVRNTNKKSGGGANPKQDQHPHHHKETVGSALLSHDLPAAVPSAQKGLTSRFGKDTGCNPLAKTTNTTNKQHPKKAKPKSVKQLST